MVAAPEGHLSAHFLFTRSRCLHLTFMGKKPFNSVFSEPRKDLSLTSSLPPKWELCCRASFPGAHTMHSHTSAASSTELFCTRVWARGGNRRVLQEEGCSIQFDPMCLPDSSQLLTCAHGWWGTLCSESTYPGRVCQAACGRTDGLLWCEPDLVQPPH